MECRIAAGRVAEYGVLVAVEPLSGEKTTLPNFGDAPFRGEVAVCPHASEAGSVEQECVIKCVDYIRAAAVVGSSGRAATWGGNQSWRAVAEAARRNEVICG